MAQEARLMPREGLPRRRLAAVALGLVSLAACGKRGDPVPPGPDEAVTFPRTFPREGGEGPALPETQQSVFPPTSRGVRGRQ
jgi:predicted small lipoprotein YifL